VWVRNRQALRMRRAIASLTVKIPIAHIRAYYLLISKVSVIIAMPDRHWADDS